MITMKRWAVEVLIDEQHDDCTTRAVARLDTSDDAHLHGFGTAAWRRGLNGIDGLDGRDEVVDTGDAAAVAKALAELARTLARRAACDSDTPDEDLRAMPADA